MLVRTLHSFDTEYSADSIEWCPHTAYRCHFVCGTYQLEETAGDAASPPPCRRKGRIYLFRFDAEAKELQEVQRLETAAILDMKWLRPEVSETPVLAVANALGQIEVFQLSEKLELRASVSLNEAHENLLALSLDWGGQQSTQRQILASDSKGDLSLLDYGAEGALKKLNSWSAHGFEAWICAFDRWDLNRVYSGGDDSFLHVHDLRSCERVLTNRSHIAGVTSLLSHPRREGVLLSGSYDEKLRVFDVRSLKRPLAELALGGGIWRIKADPRQGELLLAACMYKNFSLVGLAENGELQLRGVYEEHGSICYGADWCPIEGEGRPEEPLHMATCSFYDHKMCVASVEEF